MTEFFAKLTNKSGQHACATPIFYSLSSKMYFSEKVRLSSTSLSLMKLIGAFEFFSRNRNTAFT